MWIFSRSLDNICYSKLSFQWGSQKLLHGSLFNELTAYLYWPLLSNVCKTDKFGSHCSLKHSSINVQDLCFNFLGSDSFLESNSYDIFALRETNLEDSIYYSNFFMKGYLPLIWKDSTTHMHGVKVYLKEGLHFASDLSLENLSILICVFNWLYFMQCLTSFSSINHFLLLWTRFLVFLHLRYKRHSQSKNLLMHLSLEILTSIIRTGWPDGTDRPGKPSYKFCLIFSFLFFYFTQMVNFPTRILDSDSHSPALLVLFISSDPIKCSIVAFPIRKFWSGCLSFHWFLFKLKKRCPFASYKLWLFSCGLGWS